MKQPISFVIYVPSSVTFPYWQVFSFIYIAICRYVYIIGQNYMN